MNELLNPYQQKALEANEKLRETLLSLASVNETITNTKLTMESFSTPVEYDVHFDSQYKNDGQRKAAFENILLGSGQYQELLDKMTMLIREKSGLEVEAAYQKNLVKIYLFNPVE